MKKLLLLLVSLCITTSSFSQITELWGMTDLGGVNGRGIIFKTDENGDNFASQKTFDFINRGSAAESEIIKTSSGKLFGVTRAGGTNNAGVLYIYNTNTNTYTVLHDFESTTGMYPYNALLEASNGKLYGTTNSGGTNNQGVLYEFDTSTNTYTKLIDFDVNSGYDSKGALIQATNGKLYGLNRRGGSNDTGVLYEYDITTNIITKKIDFVTSNGSYPEGSLFQASNGKLYGTTTSGGNGGGCSGCSALGTLFEYDITTNTQTVKVNFYYASGFGGTSNGSNPKGNLVEANGKLYGVSRLNGYAGLLFEYDFNLNNYAIKKRFSNTEGTPSGGLILSSNGNLYGVTLNGGVNSVGTLFEYDINTDTYDKKYDFSNISGASPYAKLTEITPGNFYGVTTAGGSGNGVIYEFTLNSTVFNTKVTFQNYNLGSRPKGNLTQASNGQLYGMTSEGGLNNQGVLFSINPLTGNFEKLLDFDGANNGSTPLGNLIDASNGKLYGMTSEGGTDNLGVLFSYDVTSNIYTKILDFDGTNNGSLPKGSLIKATNDKLYGVTYNGGNNNFGVVFEYDITTATYTKKLDLTVRYPLGITEADNGKFYIITSNYSGYSYYGGQILEYDLDTNTTTFKYLFNSSYYLNASLIQASDGKLYTSMYNSGGSQLFVYDIASSTETIKPIPEGLGIAGELLQAPNGNIYGMTSSDGTNYQGIIYEYNPSTDTFTKKLGFNGTEGSRPNKNGLTLVTIPQTYVPDNNFEQALIDLGYDDVIDDYVITAHIIALTSLDVSSKNIADLTGIEDFSALETLVLTSNNLSTIDLSNLSALKTLYCNENSLTSIDLSNNTQLSFLDCDTNPLSSINVSGNAALEYLVCNNNGLTSLDLSNNLLLKELTCNNNSITTLDLTLNTLLYNFTANDNALASLNIKNGNNSNVITFNSLNNPDLTCIEVDNAGYSTTNWLNVDSTSSFSENCSASLSTTEIGFENFKFYPNPVQSNIYLQNNALFESYELYDLTGKLIKRDKVKTNVININQVDTGVYILKLKGGNLEKNFKLLKN